MNHKSLMVQGTMSNVGKSLMVTGLCRLLRSWGVSVAPFKPQNMALNSAVTIDRGEIGRSQALQAMACGLAPHSDMNPILLKPTGDRGAQVIVQGQVHDNMSAKEFHGFKKQAMGYVLQSYQRLCRQYERVICEGAGSPSEINLRQHDLANMGFATAVGSPVILVADIDRGGVFAQILGTLSILPKDEVELIQGIIINGFRGDMQLLDPGLDWLKERTNIPLLGVVPYLSGLPLDAEDSLSNPTSSTPAELNILVPQLPRLSNATDLQPLMQQPGVSVIMSQHYQACDVVILPGSKSVISDLHWLRQNHWPRALQRHLRYGGKIMGICGGYQMLGKQIFDPDNLEGDNRACQGLGFLDVETTIKGKKQLNNVTGQLNLDNSPFNGYEIHMGETLGSATQNPMLFINDTGHGVQQDEILGCYIHGIFDAPAARNSLLRWMGLESLDSRDEWQAQQDAAIDRLSQTLSECLDVTRLKNILDLQQTSIREPV